MTPDLSSNPLIQAARNAEARRAASGAHLGTPVPRTQRRVIGPIPPRDARGRLRLAEETDEEGRPVARDPREYLAYEPRHRPDPDAVKGLKVWEVDLPHEPLVRVYAKDAAAARQVYQREMGITRFLELEPVVREVG